MSCATRKRCGAARAGEAGCTWRLDGASERQAGLPSAPPNASSGQHPLPRTESIAPSPPAPFNAPHSRSQVQRELPRRLARRLLDLQLLPHIVVTNPHVTRVYHSYYHAFEVLRQLPQVSWADLAMGFAFSLRQGICGLLYLASPCILIVTPLCALQWHPHARRRWPRSLTTWPSAPCCGAWWMSTHPCWTPWLRACGKQRWGGKQS
jgi:hypothetical protein